MSSQKLHNAKICSKCGIMKPFSEYHKCLKNGVQSRCKQCRNNKTPEQRRKDVERVQKWYKNLSQERKEKRLQYFRDKSKERNKALTDDKKEAINAKNRIKNMSQKRIEKRRIRSRKYVMNKYYKDIRFRLLCILRTGTYRTLKFNRKTNSTIKLLGCNIDFFKKYLEQKFHPGMTWKNYGEWHIDHIIPCAFFDFSDKKQQKQCFHYTNLQPLWAKDNMKKQANIIE